MDVDHRAGKIDYTLRVTVQIEKWRHAAWALWASCGLLVAPQGEAEARPSPRPSPVAPAPIVSRVKPEIYRRATVDREIMVHADLADAQEAEPGGSRASEGREPLRSYSFYALMRVNAPLGLTRATLTNYRLYGEMVPYIDHVEFDEARRVLLIEGGIWKYQLRSRVRFDEQGDRWIHYRVVSGHFTGLEGDIFFEPFGEGGGLVYFTGAMVGRRWPPAFVVERGAEIVFGFTGKRMRSFLESQKSAPAGAHETAPAGAGVKQGASQDAEIPKPRGRLR